MKGEGVGEEMGRGERKRKGGKEGKREAGDGRVMLTRWWCVMMSEGLRRWTLFTLYTSPAVMVAPATPLEMLKKG